MNRHDHRQRGGFALIIVMLVIVVLGVMAAGFSYSMKVETRLAQNIDAESELLWLGRSGVELGCWYLAMKGRDREQWQFDALSQRWAGGPIGTNEPVTGLSLERSDLGRGSLTVEIIDQERRFNINRVPPEILERAVELMGGASLDVDIMVDSLKDWRDADDNPSLHGVESEFYLARTAPRGPHVAKNGLIDDLSELLLVEGIGPDVLGAGALNSQADVDAGLRLGAAPTASGGGLGGDTVGFAALFNTTGSQQVNINTASREVLQLLPGMDENLAEAVLQHRSGLDGRDGTEDDTPFRNVGELINVGGMPPQYVAMLRRMCSVHSQTFEIRVHARVDQYERTYVAVVRRPSPRAVDAMPLIQAYWE